MASLTKEKNGSYRIWILNEAGERKAITLNKKSSDRFVNTTRSHVEEVVASRKEGHNVPKATQTWISELTPALRKKLVGVGLLDELKSATIGKFIQELIDSKEDISANTRRNWRMTKDQLVRYFGEARELRTITEGDCDEWRQSLVNEEYAEATIGGFIKIARQAFKRALRKGLMSSNPLAEVETGSQVNSERTYFVDRETIKTVLENCLSFDRQLIVALSRYLGTRTPSETLKLKWKDVDWKNKKIRVHSPKTKKQGKPFRDVPIFVEVLPYLEAARKAAPKGAEFIVQNYNDSSLNLRTNLLKTLDRAGIEPWPRIFHNLRASRIMELIDNYPAKVVSDWMGNCEEVSKAHYQKATDDHFRRAASESAQLTGNKAESGLEKVLQKTLQSEQVSSNLEESPKVELAKKPEECTNETALDVSGHTSPKRPLGVVFAGNLSKDGHFEETSVYFLNTLARGFPPD